MKFLFAATVAITLIFSPIQKSQAAVGGIASLVVAVPALIVAGALVATTGTVITVANLPPKICGSESCKWVLGFIGLAMIPLGLVMLDNQGTVAFSEVAPGMDHLKGVSDEEIAIYNSEIDELNAINSEIIEEVVANESVDAKALWNDMGSLLSPSTLKIASLNSQLLLKSVK